MRELTKIKFNLLGASSCYLQ